jgi:methylglutaconyl-CoA hydratase
MASEAVPGVQPSRVRVQQQGGVAQIWLMRPDARNALDLAHTQQLTAALAGLAPEVRFVVLRGEGPDFCAGADLREMHRGQSTGTADASVRAAALAALFARLDAAPQVVAARVHGAALGGGAGLVACCDLVVADAGARLGFPEARLGLAPAIIAPYVLRRLGPAAARRLFLTADVLEAAAAQAVGLVDAVVPDGADAAAEDVLHTWQSAVLRNGPNAVAAIKDLLRALPDLDAEAGQARSMATLTRLQAGAEGQEGIAAFVGRRRPAWSVA